MSSTPIQWLSNVHRWAVIRYSSNPADSTWVSQHKSARAALLRCQAWIQGDPWTFPDEDTLSHFYDVEARDRAAALALALARHQVAAEDAAAGRLSRFPRFDEPGGQLLRPGEDDMASPPTAQSDLMASGRCRAPRPRRRENHDSASASGCLRRSRQNLG